MVYDFKKMARKAVDNSPGLSTQAWMAPLRTFLEVAKPTNAGVTPGDSILIDGDHTFDIADGFIPIYATQDTASIGTETIGEMDSRGSNKTGEFFYPGIDAESIEFMENAKNENWVILFENLDEKLFQMGSKMLPAEVVGSLQTGTLGSDKKGIIFTVNNFGPLYIYEGVVTEKPEV